MVFYGVLVVILFTISYLTMLLSGLFSEGKTCTTGYILADVDTSSIRSTSELTVLDDVI